MPRDLAHPDAPLLAAQKLGARSDEVVAADPPTVERASDAVAYGGANVARSLSAIGERRIVRQCKRPADVHQGDVVLGKRPAPAGMGEHPVYPVRF